MFPLLRRLIWIAMTGMATATLSERTRPSQFSFQNSGLSNRLITPNGDGRNDQAVFRFSNPMDSAVTGRVYDARGGLVAEMSSGPALGTSLLWDGRSGGQSVPSGVYIYVLQGEDKVFTGSVVVVR